MVCKVDEKSSNRLSLSEQNLVVSVQETWKRI